MQVFEVIHPCCGGLDVHKDTVVACVRRTAANGTVEQQVAFVPPLPQRELRDLTRTRSSLLQDRSRTANRLQKILEDANIKLASVASDVLGASGRDMLRALIRGDRSPAQMADLSRKRLRLKIPKLTEALSGRVSEHHRFMLKLLLDQIEQYEAQVAKLDQRIEEVMSPSQKTALGMLDESPASTAAPPRTCWRRSAATCPAFPPALTWPRGPACVQATTKVPASDAAAACNRATAGSRLL
jgi:hypothetical protein